MKAWETHFDERQLREIEFCTVYKNNFGHGTDGHNGRVIIAKMAELLDMGLVPHKVPEPQTGPMQPQNCIELTRG